MNDVFLIKKIDPSGTEKEKVSFLIANMDDPQTKDAVLDTIFHQDFEEIENIVIRYNGIVLDMCPGSIPNMVRLLCEKGVQIYGVYSLYDG